MLNNTVITNNKRNIKLILEYDGSGYAGWQRLNNTTGKKSVQNVLEDCISGYLGEDIKVIGSGRTDAGVHALGQVANFYSTSGISAEEMKNTINTLLPEDIKVIDLKEADREFHSRYSARAKTYEYRISQGDVKPVFTRKYTLHVPENLDMDSMQKAAAYLTGTFDFKAFSTDRGDGKSTIRTIESIRIYRVKNARFKKSTEEVRIAITGDGFLYNMVRIITGTLIEVGLGKRKAYDIMDILKGKDRQLAGKTVSSVGLFLLEVRY
ncbi:tRNA pseudouridine(38-40) synthase TruA [Anaerocolumna sp. MB42-C2]|uniref:tRNA pseudouridine(38-40) synthase TruA n=1 Tax=Anaerocolumna sp. MB42-C2 TaxID=3070997 RepID=UPI0027E11A2C|nr:tRNA pseudouridine(38-40) synthase TruA [Anaerocolumna sp. MB42-C2]WMJ90564.1 tRNA pseudouridine(38-40) synthase TruA [Anaerocolumna sp. MB42-C2]